MAKRNSSGGGGSTVYGVLAGLLIGLMVAAAVAYYVVKAPSPFVDKASRQPDPTAKPDPRNAPDPNAALGGGRDASSTPPSAISDAPLNPSAEKSADAASGKKPASQDELGALIATLAPTSPTDRPTRVEKPKAEDAPSNYAVIGRYILRPEILDIIETLEPGAGGEIQLTDALAIAARDPQKYGGVVGVVFSGERYDAGDKLEYLKATIQLAVKRKELGADLLAWMKTFIADK